MGHLTRVKEEYRALLHRLDSGPVGMPEPTDERAREGWKQTLELLFTPEEAAIASRMPLAPTRIETIAKRVGMCPAELEPKLEAMCDKGLVMDLVHPERDSTLYLLAPPVVGFFEFSLMRANDPRLPQKELAHAMHDYLHGDQAFANEVFGFDTVLGRALVSEEEVGDGEAPEVLDWERATAVVGDAESHAVSECYCRHKAMHLEEECGAPQEICLSLNSGAAWVARRGFGRAIDRSEALELLHQAKECKLVQIADNVRNRPTFVCNCCGCCCGMLRAINDFDLPAVNSSGFLPRLDEEACKGCSRCARACPVGAIAMEPVKVASRQRNDMRPTFDEERCIGCGVCARECRQEGLMMERCGKPVYVPATGLEKALRQTIERGRLAHLLFDEGAGRGSRFLNRVVDTLAHLPPTQQILASEQVQSRFVRATLRRIGKIDAG